MWTEQKHDTMFMSGGQWAEASAMQNSIECKTPLIT
jgi:hypothetical protein